MQQGPQVWLGSAGARYAQANQLGGSVLVAGQIGLDPPSMLVPTSLCCACSWRNSVAPVYVCLCPYSHLCLCLLQIVQGGVLEQTRQIVRNLTAILAVHDLGLADIIASTVRAHTIR